MAEPSTTLVGVGSMISIAMLSMFSGIDVPTLMGAIAGASLFVTSAKDIKFSSRILYLFISLFMGYLAGPSLLAEYFKQPALCAFIASACCISVALKLISSVEQIDITKWFKPK